AFVDVPSFATHLDQDSEVPGVGGCRIDIAYGGMFYALVDAASFELTLDRARAAELVTVGEQVRRGANGCFDLVHPENPAITGIDQLLWRGPARRLATTRATPWACRRPALARAAATAVWWTGHHAEPGTSAPLAVLANRAPTSVSARAHVLPLRDDLPEQCLEAGLRAWLLVGSVCVPSRATTAVR